MSDVITLVGTPAEPVPIGTVVKYGGTLEQRHGRFEVAAHEDPADHPYRAVMDSKTLRDAYVDGVAYVLYPVGVECSTENYRRGISFVRRTSFQVIGEENDE